MVTPLQRLKAEFFHNQNVVKYMPGFEGMLAKPDGTIALGNRAFHRHITNLCHEMAHLVEIDDARCTTSGWGLRVRYVEIMGTLCHELRTHQCTDREIRVAAYQAVLQRYLGLPSDVRSITKSFQYLPDWCNVPLEDGTQAYSDAADKTLRYAEIGPSRMRWIVAQAEATLATYTFELFRAEWDRKVELIRSRLPARQRPTTR